MTFRKTLAEIFSSPRSFFFSTLSNKGAILAYNTNQSNIIEPEEFVRQMYFIKQKGYKVVPLSEMCELLRERKPLRNCIAITFDTAYSDFFTKFFPVLKRNNFPATIFVVSALLGREINTDEGQALRIMSAGDIKRASSTNDLIEFMPHGEKDGSLAKVDTETAIKEIGMSRRFVEKLTGKVADIFAYPDGTYTDELVNHLKKGDIWLGAVAGQAGFVEKNSDPFLLRRIVVRKNMLLSDFKKMLS